MHTGCSSSSSLFFQTAERTCLHVCHSLGIVMWCGCGAQPCLLPHAGHCIALHSTKHAIIRDFCSPPSLLVCTRCMRIVCIHGAIISGSATTQWLEATPGFADSGTDCGSSCVPAMGLVWLLQCVPSCLGRLHLALLPGTVAGDGGCWCICSMMIYIIIVLTPCIALLARICVLHQVTR